MDQEALIHFIGGAVGGTAGTAVTCPLEVVKTRLQSSHFSQSDASAHSATEGTSNGRLCASHPYKTLLRKERLNSVIDTTPKSHMYSSQRIWAFRRNVQMFSKPNITAPSNRGAFSILRNIIVNEGFSALFKGLMPNLVGVAPSKAVYFYTYSSCKRLFNTLEDFVPNSAMIHMTSAATGGFVTATVINPVWLIKTRLQLHEGPLSIRNCIRKIWRQDGFKGFYRGVTASYFGISETVLQFVLYEEMRNLMLESKAARVSENGDSMKAGGISANSGFAESKPVSLLDRRDMFDFLNFMLAGGTAKFVACVLAYPHEVVRTRMREENAAIRGFIPTFMHIIHNEPFRALYRGLVVQLMRTVPNTAITMGSYELTIHLLQNLWATEE